MFGAIPFPDISPEIFAFDVFGFHLALRWYALAYIVGIGIGWQVIKAALRRPHLWRNGPPMQVAQLEDLLTYIVVGVIGGGRLGYVFVYKPADFLANPVDIIRIWDGGLSFHGGFVGVVIGVYLFSRRHSVSLPDLSDIIAVAATPSILLVRCANFINAELWGRPTDLPWGVKFPTMCHDPIRQSCPVEGDWHYYGFEATRHPSQLYEAGLEGLLLGLILFMLAFRFGALMKPWVLTAVFFIGYGLARFIVEFVRQPDAQFVSVGNELGLRLHIDGYGLTMGQLLSLPMIIAGITVLVIARRR